MKRIYIILLAALFTFTAFADNVQMVLSAPSTVEVGDKFRVQFTVNTQNVSNFSAPDFKGFDVIYGPSTSTQNSFQIINGHTSQSSSVTYTFVVMANNAGTFTIGQATVQSEGKTVRSNTVKVKVLPAGQGGGGSQQQYGGSYSQRQQQQQAQRPSQPSSSGGNISAKDLFVTATASRTNVYEQEAILVTYKVYTTLDLNQLEGKLPSLDGFQIQEIPLPRNKSLTLEQYNGRNYGSCVWSQYVLFPQKSGTITIPSVTFEGTASVSRNIDPIEAFFNGVDGYAEVKKKISTQPITIHVSPLPSKPIGFSGAVGQFELSSSINGTEVSTNDAVTIRVNVKGTGNMKLINTPEVEWPIDFETYDAKVTDNFNLTTSGLAGSKSFEYLAVPRHPGKFTVPPVKFIYFDTKTHSYKTLSTESYTINVKKGKGGSGSQAVNYSNNQQDVSELNQDIRYIKLKDGRTVNPGDALFGSMRYLLSYIIPLICFVIALIFGNRYLKENANIAKSRGKKANKKATKRLKTANKLLGEKKQNEFYDEVMRALWGYIADKLNMPQESLNKDNIQAELSAKSVPQELTDQFIKTLNDCEFARYAPSSDVNAQMESVYQSAIETISKIEDNL